MVGVLPVLRLWSWREPKSLVEGIFLDIFHVMNISKEILKRISPDRAIEFSVG
jgi:hypothetical protein